MKKTKPTDLLEQITARADTYFEHYIPVPDDLNAEASHIVPWTYAAVVWDDVPQSEFCALEMEIENIAPKAFEAVRAVAKMKNQTAENLKDALSEAGLTGFCRYKNKESDFSFVQILPKQIGNDLGISRLALELPRGTSLSRAFWLYFNFRLYTTMLLTLVQSIGDAEKHYNEYCKRTEEYMQTSELPSAPAEEEPSGKCHEGHGCPGHDHEGLSELTTVDPEIAASLLKKTLKFIQENGIAEALVTEKNHTIDLSITDDGEIHASFVAVKGKAGCQHKCRR